MIQGSTTRDFGPVEAIGRRPAGLGSVKLIGPGRRVSVVRSPGDVLRFVVAPRDEGKSSPVDGFTPFVTEVMSRE